jgi:hypothetical protein
MYAGRDRRPGCRPYLERLEDRALPGEALGLFLLTPAALFHDTLRFDGPGNVAASLGPVSQLALAGTPGNGAAAPLTGLGASPAVWPGPLSPAGFAALLPASAALPASASLGATQEVFSNSPSRPGTAALSATYPFTDGLAAEEADAPPLLPVDPVGRSGFELASVPLGMSGFQGFDRVREVYRFDGNALPTSEQAGLALDTSGLIPAGNYSVEMVFRFFGGDGNWRRILDVQDRQSDNGFYVEPGGSLQVYEDGALATGTTLFTTNAFHHVVLTNSSAGVVKAYLDGGLELTTPPTTVMRINNPGNRLNFFLDNLGGIGTGEFSSGQVALVRAYQGVLTDGQVAALAADPFGSAPGPG